MLDCNHCSNCSRRIPFLCVFLQLWLSVESFVLASSCPSASHMSSTKTPTMNAAEGGSPTSVIRQFASLHEGEENMGKTHPHVSSHIESKLGVVRNCILQVSASAGQLCAVAMQWPFQADDDLSSSKMLTVTLAELLQNLHSTASALDLNLAVAIQAKLKLNEKKYPVELCKGKAGKYTQYSQVTGVNKTNQSTVDSLQAHAAVPLKQLVSTMPAVAQQVDEFATARQWARFHTPRNLVLALMGEVGELAELLQWKGDTDHEKTLTQAELDKLSQELADVSIYLTRIATVCGVVEPMCEALNGASALGE